MSSLAVILFAGILILYIFRLRALEAKIDALRAKLGEDDET